MLTNSQLPVLFLLVKAMVFRVVMHGCESWTIKKAEHQRIDAFELWWWRRLLRVPWTARRPNQSIQKEISPEYSLEGLMLKLKLQYFSHLMLRTDLFEKTLMLGKIEGSKIHIKLNLPFWSFLHVQVICTLQCATITTTHPLNSFHLFYILFPYLLYYFY